MASSLVTHQATAREEDLAAHDSDLTCRTDGVEDGTRVRMASVGSRHPVEFDVMSMDIDITKTGPPRRQTRTSALPASSEAVTPASALGDPDGESGNGPCHRTRGRVHEHVTDQPPLRPHLQHHGCDTSRNLTTAARFLALAVPAVANIYCLDCSLSLMKPWMGLHP